MPHYLPLFVGGAGSGSKIRRNAGWSSQSTADAKQGAALGQLVAQPVAQHPAAVLAQAASPVRCRVVFDLLLQHAASSAVLCEGRLVGVPRLLHLPTHFSCCEREECSGFTVSQQPTVMAKMSGRQGAVLWGQMLSARVHSLSAVPPYSLSAGVALMRSDNGSTAEGKRC